MFGRGVALGLAIAATLLLVYLAWESRQYEHIYRDFGSAELPAITQFLFGPWHVVAPVTALVAVTALALRRPTSIVIYALVGALVLGAAVFTWYAARAPLYELAGNISE